MSIGRTILALLIALSGRNAAGRAAGRRARRCPVDGICPQWRTCRIAVPPMTDPCDKAMGDCASMAACGPEVLQLRGKTSFSNIVFPSRAAKMPAPIASNPFASQTGSPPFRPPRI